MVDLTTVAWIHGSSNCATNTDPPLQVVDVDGATFVLRQNKCATFEAPFLYLLFGMERALLLDSGARPVPGHPFPLRDVVEQLVDDWLVRQHESSIELVIAHTHGHGDHVFGDAQFVGRPRTTIVGRTRNDVKTFFGLANWPGGEAVFDLGGRELTVLPVPGHEGSDLAFYDGTTQFLYSGDTFYPGFLFVRDWMAYHESIERLVQFSVAHPVQHFLGAHIEMTRIPGVAFPSGTTYQPNEHPLPLTAEDLRQLHESLVQLGETPHRKVLDHFIIEPLIST